MDLIKEMERYFLMVSSDFFQIVCRKKYWQGKIQLLDYLSDKGIKLSDRIWQLSDMQTYDWLKSKNYPFTGTFHLNEYSLLLWNHCKKDGHRVEFTRDLIIPLDDIDQLEMSTQDKARFYAKHDVTFSDLKNVDVKLLLRTAIRYKAKKVIKFLMDSYSNLEINAFHYYIVDDNFKDYLLTQRQSIPDKWDENAFYFFHLSLKYIQIFYHRYPKPLEFWLIALLYNRVDICEFLEWQGHTLPYNTLDCIVDYTKRDKLKVICTTIDTLIFCQRRNLVFPPEYINFITKHCSEETILWLLDNNFTLTSKVYLSLAVYGSLSTLYQLKNKGIIPENSHQLKYRLYGRNNPEILNFFAQFDINPFQTLL